MSQYVLTAVGLWPHFATRRHGPRRLAGPAASHPLFGIIARAYGIIALPIIPIPVVPIRPPSAAGIAARSLIVLRAYSIACGARGANHKRRLPLSLSRARARRISPNLAPNLADLDLARLLRRALETRAERLRAKIELRPVGRPEAERSVVRLVQAEVRSAEARRADRRRHAVLAVCVVEAVGGERFLRSA